MSPLKQFGAYLALVGARIRLEDASLGSVLDNLEVNPIALANDHLEQLLERGRLRYPGFTCLHAALAFRQLKDVRICLGVNPTDVTDGHAWVEDSAGNVWLFGPRQWRQVWREPE